MKKRYSVNIPILLKIIVTHFLLLGTISVFAQNYSFIEHKPTDWRFHSCSTSDGTAVTANASGDTSDCAQWRQISNGSYFHLANRRSGKYIRPNNSNNGSPIVLRPNTWTGNWTQWSYEDRGDGYGHLVNKATGKFVFIASGSPNGNLQLQPSSWRGDFTRWRFVDASGGGGSTPEPTDAPTAVPTAEPTDAPTAVPTAAPTATVTTQPTDAPTAVPTDEPTVPPNPSTVKIEAELGSVFGGASIYNDGAASGGAGVAYISSVGAGFSLTNVPASDSVTIVYASQLSGAISMRVNSSDVGNVSFSSTGNWTGSYNSVDVSVNIPLNATVEIFFDNGDSAMNVDYINFNSGGGGATPLPTSNPTSTPISSTPEPTPTAGPTDEPTPGPTSDPSGDFGYESNGLIWFRNQSGWPSGGDYYNCRDLENDCFPASYNSSENRWERVHGNLTQGQTYTAQLKVPGFAASDFPRHQYTWEHPTIGNGGGGGGGGGGGTPGCTELSCLDDSSNSLLSGKGSGPGPRPNPPGALRTPTNGSSPTSHGFAFDLNGSTFTWRWGGQIVKGGGDSGLQVWCSKDGGLTYDSANFSGGSATAPCSGNFEYFFRYLHPTHSLNNNPAHQWIYTGPFTTAGSRVNPNGYSSFVDGSSNWMRFRHPVSHDGTTAAILDAQHNNDLLRNLDRYNIWVNDSPGNVQFNLQVAGSILRNEALRNTAGGPNGQQFFAVNRNPGFGNVFSYGQVIQFEVTAVAGGTGAQTYNDFSYYTVGLGWSNYGDKRLASAGKAGTTMVLSDAGTYSNLEYNAIFTQPLVTLHSEVDMDDFILGHHLFHGIDPNVQGSTAFDVIKIGDRTCGDCHFRDGRGSEVIQTSRGPRLPPPTYGTGLLLAIQGREVGLAWDGRDNTMEERVRNALDEDHGVNANDLPGRVFDLLVHYTEVLTVPDRNPVATDDPQINAGHDAFMAAGCGNCHTPVQTTSSSNDAYDGLTIRPYTDMKLWNLGEGNFRTAPLWGLGHNIRLLEQNGRAVLFMHDGASSSINQAVQRHGGSAASSRSAYNSGNSAAIDAYVRSL